MRQQDARRDDKSPFFATDELIGEHSGKPAFVIGNGLSVKFYDTDKMAEKGVMIGCNLGFQIHKLDYLCWQDTKIAQSCAGFKGNKVTSYKHCSKTTGNMVALPGKRKNWYCFPYGKKLPEGFNKINTGGLALQLAILMECDPIFLVGIDGCFVTGPNGDTGSNMFTDKAKVKKDVVKQRGKNTTSHLFAHILTIEEMIKKYDDYCNVFQLGDWGLVNVPHVDFPEFYGREHPKKGNN